MIFPARELSRTKPSTIRRSDMNNFSYDVDGFGSRSLLDVFRGVAIESVAIPVGHSLTAAWLVLVSLNNGVLIELCSIYNDLGDWREVGSLRLRLIAGSVHDAPDVEWVSHNVGNFTVSGVEKIGYSESDFHTECGLCLVSVQGTEIWFVTAPAPGSVSIKLPDSCEDFVTEFPIGEYTRTLLVA